MTLTLSKVSARTCCLRRYFANRDLDVPARRLASGVVDFRRRKQVAVPWPLTAKGTRTAMDYPSPGSGRQTRYLETAIPGKGWSSP